jgi:hypothetical protein
MTTVQPAPVVKNVTDLVAVLESLDGDTYNALLTFPDGTVQRFTLGVLSYAEYNEIIAANPMPSVPRKFSKDAGGFIEKDDDEKYQAARIAVQDARQLQLLAASALKGGYTLKGGSLKEQAAWFKARATSVVGALLTVFTQAHHGMKGSLERQADGFHRVPGAGLEGTPTVGPENAG